jgi:hypothetical protein
MPHAKAGAGTIADSITTRTMTKRLRRTSISVAKMSPRA